LPERIGQRGGPDPAPSLVKCRDAVAGLAVFTGVREAEPGVVTAARIPELRGQS
jgi:hypothetical protein